MRGIVSKSVSVVVILEVRGSRRCEGNLGVVRKGGWDVEMGSAEREIGAVLVVGCTSD